MVRASYLIDTDADLSAIAITRKAARPPLYADTIAAINTILQRPAHK